MKTLKTLFHPGPSLGPSLGPAHPSLSEGAQLQFEAHPVAFQLQFLSAFHDLRS
jgi:hypothetical protein